MNARIYTLRSVVVALLLIAVLVTVAGCQAVPVVQAPAAQPEAPAQAEAPQEEAPAPPEVTLTYLDFWTELEDYMLQSIDMFQEEHPNVTIERTTAPWNEAETVLKTNIAGGTPFDIATYWPMYMKSFLELDAAKDLTPYITADDGAWKENLGPLAELGNYDGTYYAVPFKSIYAVLYYNQDVFDELGLEVPETIDELETVMQTIQDKTDMAPLVVFDGVQGWIVRWMFPALADEAGVLDEWIAGDLSADDPQYRPIYSRPYEIAQSWQDRGYFYGGAGAAGVSRDEAKVAFANKEVAIIAETTSEVASIASAADFPVGVMRFPSVVNPPRYYFFGGADGFFVSADAPDEAVEFLKFMTSPEMQKWWLDNAGITPVNPQVEIDDPVVKQFVEWSQYLQPFEFYSLTPEIQKYIDASVGELIIGAKTVDEIVNDLEALRLEAGQE